MASPPTANRRTKSRWASSRGSTTKSASSNEEHTGCAMKSTFGSKSSPVCCQCSDASPCFGLESAHTTSRRAKTLGRSLPGIRYGLGKRRYREIARCGPRDDCGEHSGWGKRERRQQANVSFHLALVLRDLGERLNATRYEIVDPSPCFDDRQQDGVACLRFQHRLAARLMQNPFHGNEGRRIPRHGDDRRRRDCGILVTITRVRRCGRPVCFGCLDGTCFSQVDFDRFWTDDDAFDEPVDRLAIGDVAVTFGRRIFP